MEHITAALAGLAICAKKAEVFFSKKQLDIEDIISSICDCLDMLKPYKWFDIMIQLRLNLSLQQLMGNRSRHLL